MARISTEAKNFNVGALIAMLANTGERRTQDFAWNLGYRGAISPADRSIQAELIPGNVIVPGRFVEISASSNSPSAFTVVSTYTPYDPDPKIGGTTIPIYRIAALIDGGLTVDQVIEDFPSLTRSQITDALMYSQANPHPVGNPYPKESLKRLLRNSGFRQLDRALKNLNKKKRKRAAAAAI